MQGTPVGKLGSEKMDLGTPSAPPIVDLGSVCESEAGSEKNIDSQYKEDEAFAEQCGKSVKTEAEVVQRYNDRDARGCI